MKLFLILTIFFQASIALRAADPVFQYHLEIEDSKGRSRDTYLWIPPEIPRIRGVLMSTQTLIEAYLSSDEQVRKACAEQGIAIVFCKTGSDAEGTQSLLDRYAEASGYAELKTVPLFFVGHSAGGGWANRMARDLPDRCFGLMTYRGGLPWGASADIPSLVMVGQYDEFGGRMRTAEGQEPAWENPRNSLRKMLSEKPRARYGLVVEPGTGHFAWSDKNADMFSDFLEAAARLQITEGGDSLNRIPYEEGWLVSLDLRTVADSEPRPASEEVKDPTEWSWFPTRELAEQAIAFHEGLTGRKDQFVRWENRHWVDAGARFFFMGLDFDPGTATFTTEPVYADKVPGQYNGNGPIWHNAGEAVGNSGAPITVHPVGGPVVAAGDGRMRIQYSTLFPQGKRSRLTFIARSPGNDEYRPTEHVGMAPRGYKGIRKGKSQSITFPALPETVPADSDPLDLKATSDSGMPVRYYIAYGPGVVEEGKLVITNVPKRAEKPIELKIVATQPGSGKDPKIAQADAVSHILHIQ